MFVLVAEGPRARTDTCGPRLAFFRALSAMGVAGRAGEWQRRGNAPWRTHRRPRPQRYVVCGCGRLRLCKAIASKDDACLCGAKLPTQPQGGQGDGQLQLSQRGGGRGWVMPATEVSLADLLAKEHHGLDKIAGATRRAQLEQLWPELAPPPPRPKAPATREAQGDGAGNKARSPPAKRGKRD